MVDNVREIIMYDESCWKDVERFVTNFMWKKEVEERQRYIHGV